MWSAGACEIQSDKNQLSSTCLFQHLVIIIIIIMHIFSEGCQIAKVVFGQVLLVSKHVKEQNV